MPTTSRMHLSDNYTRREVYDVYRSEMVVLSNKLVTYSQFTRLWRAWFRNVIIPYKVRMGYYSICANLKSLAKGAKTSMEKDAWLIIGQLDLTSSLHNPMFTMTQT